RRSGLGRLFARIAEGPFHQLEHHVADRKRRHDPVAGSDPERHHQRAQRRFRFRPGRHAVQHLVAGEGSRFRVHGSQFTVRRDRAWAPRRRCQLTCSPQAGGRLLHFGPRPMRIALVVPPFITVPPERYGGTELFVAHLAEGLREAGHEPVVYTVGASKVNCETRWRSRRGEWPIASALESSLEDLDHSSWACQNAGDCDLIHLNNAPGLHLARFVRQPMVYTLHHPHEPALSRHYAQYPQVQYVAISRDQARRERMPRLQVVRHGLDLEQYALGGGRRDYLCVIGRIAPIKGTHTAIAVARAAGLPLKIAGEVQPLYRDYWEHEIRPQLGGDIEYIGEVNLKEKNQLLGGARAMLFPIEWEEPFGLVMIEAMACGAPVLAFGRGSVPEVVEDGISGWICRHPAEMAERAGGPLPAAAECRNHVAAHFSTQDMVRHYLDLYAGCLESAPEDVRPRHSLAPERLPLAS